MEELKRLAEIEEAVLRHVQDRSSTLQNIIKNFSSSKYNDKSIADSVEILETGKGYIKQKRLLRPGVYSFGQKITDDDSDDYYQITPLGKNYLASVTANFTSFSNIQNSNVASNSANVVQSINISEQPQDIQEKIKELELAVVKKNPSGIKKAFGYIADKSVSVAVAILAGTVLK